jgi:tetratricopeptide (TPR) repeat protein
MAYQSEIEKLEARFREKPEQWFAALADAYRKAGDVDMALEVLGAWIDKRPTYTSGHIVRGRCLLDRERFRDAAQAFEQVLALDMENVIALKSLAEIAERSGDAVAARGWLKRLLDVDPMNDEAREALVRLGGDEKAPAAAPPGAPEAMAATGLAFVDLDREEPGELAIERTSEAFDISKMAARPDEAFEVGLPGQVEGLEFTAAEGTTGTEAQEPPETPNAVEAPEPEVELERASEPIEFAAEPAAPAAAFEFQTPDGGAAFEAEGVVAPHAPEASEPVESVDVSDAEEPPEAAGVPPVAQRVDGPGPSLDLATGASDWEVPEPPPPAPKPVARPDEAPAIAAVPDLEPMVFAPVEEPEPVPIEGLAPAGFEAAFEEFAAQAGPLETAAEPEPGPETDDDLPIIVPPAASVPPRASASVTADDVEFVQPPIAEKAPAPEPTPAAQPDAADRGELPLILPEEVSTELDEPSIREPEPVVTETMAALYASQGLYTEARDTYRKLLARDPGNARLQSLLEEADKRAAGTKMEPASRRERYAAAPRGALSVGKLMQDLASATPEGEPLEGAASAIASEEHKAAGSAFSFDEFFSEDDSRGGSGGEPGAADPGKPEDDDFRGWLEGLKT